MNFEYVSLEDLCRVRFYFDRLLVQFFVEYRANNFTMKQVL